MPVWSGDARRWRQPLTLPGEANGESRVKADGSGPAGKEMLGKTFRPWEQHIPGPTYRKQQVLSETETEYQGHGQGQGQGQGQTQGRKKGLEPRD